MTALEMEKTIALEGWRLWRTKHKDNGELMWNVYQKNDFTLFIDVEGNMFLYDDEDKKSEFVAMVTKSGDYTKFLSTIRMNLNKKRASQ